jgi:hypothetical protein
MGKNYRAYLPEQDFLLPPSPRDWLPEDHLAYFVSDVVEQLDLSTIESVYEKEERGQPTAHGVQPTTYIHLPALDGRCRHLPNRQELPHQRRDDREVLRVTHQNFAQRRCNQRDATEEKEVKRS